MKYPASVLVIVLLLAFFVWALMNNSEQDSPTWAGACVAAEQFVKQNLKSPATTQFGPCRSENVSTGNNNIYQVSGYVDAQNAYGATLRNSYSAQMQYQGGQWHLINVAIFP